MNSEQFFAFQKKYSTAFNPINSWPASFYQTLYCSTKWPGAVFHNLRDPALIKEVLLDRIEDFRKAPLAHEMLAPMLGDGLVTAEGASWQQQRKTANPAFRSRVIDALVPLVLETGARLADRLARCDPKTPVCVFPEIADATLSVVAKAFFGDAGHAIDRPEAVAALGTYLENYSSPKADITQSAIKYLHAAASDVIASRLRSSESSEDLLGLLLSGYSGDLSISVARDNIVTFILAGHETTASGLSWALYLLAANPDIQQQAYEEAITSAEVAPESWNYETLPLLRRITLEAMRLFPPIPNLFRQAIRDTQIGDVRVGRGDLASILIYPMHRNRMLWEDPEKFDPDRFLPERAEGRHPCAFLPFSIGPRSCIGLRLAQLELVIMLAAILKRCRFSALPNYSPKPVVRIALRPDDGMPLYVGPR